MALIKVGSLVLNIFVFLTTLVSFSYALISLDSFFLLVFYAGTKVFVTAPEAGIFAKCQHRHLYHDG
jgi:hypothetical protein